MPSIEERVSELEQLIRDHELQLAHLSGRLRTASKPQQVRDAITAMRGEMRQRRQDAETRP